MNALPRLLERALLDEAERRYPDEAAGMLVRKGKRIAFVPGRNISREPQKASRLHPDDYEAALESGEIAFHFHSHTDECADPSPGDKAMSEKHGIPMVIVSWPSRQVRFYFPNGWTAPLLGRPFVHGVLDCYAAVRDYWQRKHGVVFPDFEREDDWWLDQADEAGTIVRPHRNLYLDNIEAAGFSRVPDGLRVDDVILFQIGSQKGGAPVPPNHAAVYLGDGQIFHHAARKLSRVQPYAAEFGYYAQHAYGVYRHASLAGAILPPWRIEESA